MLFVCLFIAVDEAAPYGVSEQTGLPRLLKTKPQEGSLKATDGGGQGPWRFPNTATGETSAASFQVLSAKTILAT